MSETSGSGTKPTRKEVLAEINRLRNELGTYPKRREFQEHSKFDKADVTHHFEWWGDAISAARSTTVDPDESTGGTENSIGTGSGETEQTSEGPNSTEASMDRDGSDRIEGEAERESTDELLEQIDRTIQELNLE